MTRLRVSSGVHQVSDKKWVVCCEKYASNVPMTVAERVSDSHAS